MNLAGLFDPLLIFVDEEEPGAVALGIRDPVEFKAVVAELLEAERLLDGYDLTRAEIIEEIVVQAGPYVLVDQPDADWYVAPITSAGGFERVLSQPFEATMAWLPV